MIRLIKYLINNGIVFGIQGVMILIIYFMRMSNIMLIDFIFMLMLIIIPFVYIACGYYILFPVKYAFLSGLFLFVFLLFIALLLLCKYGYPDSVMFYLWFNFCLEPLARFGIPGMIFTTIIPSLLVYLGIGLRSLWKY